MRLRITDIFISFSSSRTAAGRKETRDPAPHSCTHYKTHLSQDLPNPFLPLEWWRCEGSRGFLDTALWADVGVLGTQN